MPAKLQNVQKLLKERISALWKDIYEYTSFLETASRLYKYSFKDQILIHAQRPDAVACAEYDTWGREDITNRYIKRGSKGIALISEDNGKAKLRYVFDFADTVAKDERSRTPFFWKVTDRNEESVIRQLSSTAESLGRAVKDKANELVKLRSAEFLPGILEERDNTFLNGLDDLNIQYRFEMLLKASVSYAVLTRCGYDAEAFINLEDLRGIYEFNSIRAMTVLGDAVSSISEQILRNIEQTLKVERSRNYEQSITENHDRERDTVPSGRSNTDLSAGYDDGRTERDRQVRTSQENLSEGEEELGVSGNADRGYSELSSGGNRRNSAEETRPDAPEDDERSRGYGGAESERSDSMGWISEQPESVDRGTAPERTDLHLTDNTEHEAVSEDNSDTAFSVLEEAKSRISEYIDKEFGNEADFSDLSNVSLAFTTDEDSFTPIEVYADLVEYRIVTLYDDKIVSEKKYDSLEDMLGPLGNLEFDELVALSDEEKTFILEEAGSVIPADLFTEQEMLGIIRKYDHIRTSKQAVLEFFLENDDAAERADYLKSIYNDDYTEFSVGSERYGYKTQDEGLLIYKGSFLSSDQKQTISWSRVQELTAKLIDEHEFLDISDTFDIEPDIEETGGYDEPQQLSLFSDMDIPEIPTDNYSSETAISQDMIDYVLRAGSIKPHSLERVVSQFQKNKGIESNSAFLSKEFGTNGCGFEYDSPDGLKKTKIAAWYDKDGITLGIGNTAHNRNSSVSLTWEQAAERIGEMLSDGRFTTQDIIDNAEPFTRKELADKLWYLHQDVEVEYFIPDNFFDGGFPESTMKIAEALQGEKPIQECIDGLTDLIEQYEADRDVLRFHFHKMPEMLEELKDLQRERLVFRAEPSFMVEHKYFITDDEKDKFILSGSGVEGGKFRISDFFSTPHSTDEKIKFLKKEYGTGGRGDSSYNEWHDAKGVVLQKGGYGDSEAKAKMTWNEVSDRITKLISQKRYITDEDISEKNRLERILNEDNEIEEAAETALEPPKAANIADIPQFTGEKHDYRITDDDLGSGGAKTKYKANIEAIKLLNTLGSENRYATPEEQEVLSKYVGWGGMPQAFDENNSSWSAEYKELRSLLSSEEYENAKASTLTAFYTSPAVISAIYEGLENLGFMEGNVLEPAMGVGNFFGMMPDEMRKSRLYGVELDSISGKIAKQLYQTADIQVTGFERTQFPDNFFDVAVGNVPFGQYKLSEKRYDKLNLNIHDHFFAKSIDKVRAGGVIAFVTSKGTLDKANPSFRKYLAQRAELIGAIRLPNNAFKDNAGTEVTSDIIFLQKRDKMLDIEPDWVHLGTTADGVPVNRYFEEHPEMILGEMKQSMEFSLYGNSEETACVPIDGAILKDQLKEAVRNIQGYIPEIERDEDEKEEKSIPADADVKNFSYTVIDDNIYYRENSRMFLKEDMPKVTAERIKGMVELRDCVRTLIDYQLNEYSDYDIRTKQRQLNDLYDSFTRKYGLINSRGNANAFSEDSSYYLLSSLEILNENGELERKADMFSKRTIKQKTEVNSVDTASEALAVSISEKAAVDMSLMEQLTGKTEEELYNDLKGVIFLNPLHNADNGVSAKYLTADEYLSGNIREKLDIAKRTAELYPEDYSINVEALTNAMPKPLEASEIDVRLGATWLDTDTIKQFICETLQVSRYMQNMFDVHFSKFTSEWQIEGKNTDRSNVMANVTFGTGRKNAYSIIEDTLNLRDTRVYDRVEQPDGKVTSVLNKKETMIAQEKQEAIKNAFRDWIFKDPDRREMLVNKYNTLFNSSRPREYDGSHITFSGMTPEIQLRPHQLNAIAHVMYGGNTLLAHQVGAGKSFEMIASAMESKRLGLCTKSLFVVPNHLTEQMGAEFLRLYPAANILVATKKDFEAKNRKKLCSRIATGDYDAVIIGHSQLEKIPVSAERQERIIRNQIREITDGIEELSRKRGDNFSIKQLEKTKKNLEAKLDKLVNSTDRDDVVTFEELGIDKMFVDEAHSFKNLFLYTKMRNVAGIQQTEAQKSADLYMKCQYLDELTGGKGCTFATGTPISNSMTELYTMMRYLQADKLKEMGMQNFDAWAANFGEAVTAIELAPEGTGYRAKTRFSRFFNLPELINVFKECADIKTADMLNLPVPEAEFHNVVVKPSDIQKEMVEGLSERARLIHEKAVAPEEDNMLKVTNDGRKIGLDQRLIDPLLPDEPDSKVNACVANVLDIYHKHDDTKATQLIFCDFSTPKNDGSFNLYDDIRNKLVANGVPKEEVVFIHEADSEAKKKELFSKVRKGQVRVLIGSTAKCGAGTNIQDKLIALHHLDCPWRPSDLEQREGRIIRQGNENSKVEVFRYMTESTFDAYLYQTIENKQRFISQIMSSKSPVRSCEDVDEATLSYAEVKALCAGNPLIKEKMDLDVAVTKLKVSKANHTSQQYNLEDSVRKHFPERIAKTEQRIVGLEHDLAHMKAQPAVTEGISPMTVMNMTYTDKEEAGKAILLACKSVKAKESIDIGSYKGFDMSLSYDSFTQEFHLDLQREMTYTITLGTSETGNILRIDNALDSIEKRLENSKEQLATLNEQLETAKSELGKPFPQEEELQSKLARLAELNAILDIDGNGVENAEIAAEKMPLLAGKVSDKKASILDKIRNLQKKQSDKTDIIVSKNKTNEIC